MNKKKIKEYLEDKGIYNEGYDFLIKILCDQITLYNAVMKQLKAEGISVAGNAEGTFMVRNQHLKSVQEIISTINSLSRKLSISPKDFNDLGLTNEDDDDGFDDFK